MALTRTLQSPCLGLTLVCLAAGHGQAETLVFDPKPQDTRSYHAELSVRSGESEQSYLDATYISSLTRFEVTGGGPDEIALRVYPDWFAIHSDGTTFGSALGDVPEELAELMREGLDATVERGSGRLTDVRAHGDAELPDDVIGQLRAQFRQPAAPIAIEVEQGWSTTTEIDGVHNVTVTVTRVTQESVYLNYEGADGYARLSGLAVLDRDSGWIERQVLTEEIDVGIGEGETSVQRLTVAMAVRGSSFPVRADMARQPARWYDMPDAGPAPLEPLPGETEIFGDPVGSVESFDRGLGLSLPLPVALGDNVGRFEMGPLRAYAGDRDLGIEFVAESPVVMMAFRGEADFRAATLARPLGIGDVQAGMEEATELRADLSWYPADPFTITLRPDAEARARATKNGATATFGPTEEGYALDLSGQMHDRFSVAFPDAAGVRGRIYAGDKGPDWLTPTESQARGQAAADPAAIHIALRADSTPEEITIRVNRHAGQPAATREVVYLTERGARLDPDREPETIALFPEGAPPVLEGVEPEGMERAALRFRLSRRQAGHCRARLDDATPLAGHGFIFVGTETEGQGGSRMLELRTDDERRAHFYGYGDAVAVLDCDALAVWEEADLQPGTARPWVIDPAALDLDPSETVGELFAEWRFRDAAGMELTLTSPQGGAAASDATVEEATYPDGTLRVAGRPVRFEHAATEPGPVTRRFEVRFPDLPSPYAGPDAEAGEDAR